MRSRASRWEHISMNNIVTRLLGNIQRPCGRVGALTRGQELAFWLMNSKLETWKGYHFDKNKYIKSKGLNLRAESAVRNFTEYPLSPGTTMGRKTGLKFW